MRIEIVLKGENRTTRLHYVKGSLYAYPRCSNMNDAAQVRYFTFGLLGMPLINIFHWFFVRKMRIEIVLKGKNRTTLFHRALDSQYAYTRTSNMNDGTRIRYFTFGLLGMPLINIFR